MHLDFRAPKINIQPKENIIVQELTSILINIETVNLFKSANIQVAYFDVNGNYIKMENLIMDGDDYKNWNNDDQYVYSYVYSKLNITPL